MTFEQALKKLRGTAKSVAKLNILRCHEKLEKSVVREKMILPNVNSEMFMFKDLEFGYAKLAKFTSARDCTDLKTIFAKFQENADGAVLDLRENTGGLTDVAICIAGIFLGPTHPVVRFKTEVREYFPEAVMKRFRMMPTEISEDDLSLSDKLLEDGTVVSYAPNAKLIYNKFLVVLVDKASASSSELLAAALRDRNRAIIVGADTFGKGTSMDRRALSPEERLMILGTSRRFFSPNGKTHHGVGIKVQIPSFVGLEPTIAETVKRREQDIFIFPLPTEELGAVEEETIISNELKKYLLRKTSERSPKGYANINGPPADDMCHRGCG